MFRPVAAVAALLISTAAASGATFLIDFSVNGSQGYTGSFAAPFAGGAVSAFTANIGGVIFDVQDSVGAIVYDAAVNDFTTTISFTNSNATGLCPVAACDLTLFPDPSPIPGDYQAIAPDFSNFDDGTKYSISLVPLPATALLLLGALGLLGLRRSVGG